MSSVWNPDTYEVCRICGLPPCLKCCFRGTVHNYVLTVLAVSPPPRSLSFETMGVLGVRFNP